MAGAAAFLLLAVGVAFTSPFVGRVEELVTLLDVLVEPLFAPVWALDELPACVVPE